MTGSTTFGLHSSGSLMRSCYTDSIDDTIWNNRTYCTILTEGRKTTEALSVRVDIHRETQLIAGHFKGNITKVIGCAIGAGHRQRVWIEREAREREVARPISSNDDRLIRSIIQ